MIAKEILRPPLNCAGVKTAASLKKICITIRAGEVRKSWPRIVFALLDYGVRRCRQLERFCRFLSHTLGTFSLFLRSVSFSGKWYSNDRARSSPLLAFVFLLFGFLKPHCNVLLHSHERLGGCVVSGTAAALRRSGFASSSFGCSTSCLHYMICGCIRRIRMKNGAIFS